MHTCKEFTCNNFNTAEQNYRTSLLGNISLVYYTNINKDKQSLHMPSCWGAVKQFSDSTEFAGVLMVSSTNVNA
jgi:hypothetical protein